LTAVFQDVFDVLQVALVGFLQVLLQVFLQFVRI